MDPVYKSEIKNIYTSESHVTCGTCGCDWSKIRTLPSPLATTITASLTSLQVTSNSPSLHGNLTTSSKGRNHNYYSESILGLGLRVVIKRVILGLELGHNIIITKVNVYNIIHSENGDNFTL